MCALKWYVQSLYRHLFLEDISKHARVTKKWHILILNKVYAKAPWPQRPKLGVRIAKALSYGRMNSPPPPPPPELWSLEEVGSQKFRGRTANFCDSASSNHHNSGRGGGSPGKKKRKKIHTTTAKGFSNPHTKFGALRSRRLGINLVKN